MKEAKITNDEKVDPCFEMGVLSIWWRSKSILFEDKTLVNRIVFESHDECRKAKKWCEESFDITFVGARKEPFEKAYRNKLEAETKYEAVLVAAPKNVIKDVMEEPKALHASELEF